MKKLLTNNLGLKLLSVLFAVMLWLLVVSIDDPYEYRDYSPIQVTVLNESVVTDQGKVYKIENNSDVISVRVWARGSVHKTLSSSDFTATADMKKNSKGDGSLIGIEIKCSNKDIDTKNITLSRQNVEISIEDGSTEQFNVVAEQDGEAADGYIVGTATPAQGLIEISGPASVISEIDKVAVKIDTTGVNSDRTLHGDLTLYDSDGDEIDDTYLEYTGKDSGMDVSVTVLRTKTVTLEVGHTGTPADGYSFSSISYKPETVEIAGTAEAIRSITTITVPDEAVNIDGITEDLQTSIDLNAYLPDGIRLVDTDTAVAVEVKIEKKQGKTVEISASEIGIQNAPKGLEVDFGDLESVEIIVMGTSAQLAELDTDEIAVSLDLEEYTKAGTYTATLHVTLPDDYSLMEDVEVEFQLVKGTGESTTTSGSSGTTADKSSQSGNASESTDTDEETSGSSTSDNASDSKSDSKSDSVQAGSSAASKSDSTEGESKEDTDTGTGSGQ